MVKVMYSIEDAIHKIKGYISTGKVTITRFSDTNFKPLLQNTYPDWNQINGEKGCYAFIEGLENSYALNHKQNDWYNHTPFWKAEIQMNTLVKAPKYSTDKWISIKEYLEYILNKYNQILKEEGNVSWTSMDFCSGIFFNEDCIVHSIKKASSIWLKEEQFKQSLTGRLFY